MIRESLINKFKKERLPLSDNVAVLEHKKNFGARGRGRPKRKLDTLDNAVEEEQPLAAKIVRTGVSILRKMLC